MAVVGGASWGQCHCLPFPSPALPLISPLHCHSPHQPPHEQSLVRLGVGGTAFLCCHCHHVIPVPFLHSSHLFPSHPLVVSLQQQWWWWWCPLLIVCVHVIHPLIVVGGAMPPILTIVIPHHHHSLSLSYLFPIPVAPCFHPMSCFS